MLPRLAPFVAVEVFAYLLQLLAVLNPVVAAEIVTHLLQLRLCLLPLVALEELLQPLALLGRERIAPVVADDHTPVLGADRAERRTAVTDDVVVYNERTVVKAYRITGHVVFTEFLPLVAVEILLHLLARLLYLLHLLFPLVALEVFAHLLQLLGLSLPLVAVEILLHLLARILYLLYLTLPIVAVEVFVHILQLLDIGLPLVAVEILLHLLARLLYLLHLLFPLVALEVFAHLLQLLGLSLPLVALEVLSYAFALLLRQRIPVAGLGHLAAADRIARNDRGIIAPAARHPDTAPGSRLHVGYNLHLRQLIFRKFFCNFVLRTDIDCLGKGSERKARKRQQQKGARPCPPRRFFT